MTTLSERLTGQSFAPTIERNGAGDKGPHSTMAFVKNGSIW